MKGGLAGNQDFQIRAGTQELGHHRCRRQHVLEVVQEEQEVTVSEGVQQAFREVGAAGLQRNRAVGQPPLPPFARQLDQKEAQPAVVGVDPVSGRNAGVSDAKLQDHMVLLSAERG